jgi:hypothetical protein
MQNYRGSSSSLLGQGPLLPKLNGQVTFDVTEDVPKLQARDVDDRERQAHVDESEHSMSYFDATHSRDAIKKMSVVVSLPDKYVWGVCTRILYGIVHIHTYSFRSLPFIEMGTYLGTSFYRTLDTPHCWYL